MIATRAIPIAVMAKPDPRGATRIAPEQVSADEERGQRPQVAHTQRRPALRCTSGFPSPLSRPPGWRLRFQFIASPPSTW